MLALLCAAAIGQIQPIVQAPDVAKLREQYEKAQASYVNLCQKVQRHEASLKALKSSPSLRSS